MVFQSYALYPHMTVEENMAYGLTLAKCPKKEITRRVHEAANILQLTLLLERKPAMLSGGQRQRVAIGTGHWSRSPLYCCSTNPSLTLMLPCVWKCVCRSPAFIRD